MGAALAAGLLATALIAISGPGGHAPPASPGGSAPAAVKVTSVQLLALRAADPQGGPPWGLRVVRTARGWTCVQVGRVVGRRFGELALDGAYNGDGRLHATPPARVPEESVAGSGHTNNECLEPGETFSGQIGALDRSAAFSAQERAVPPADLRQISFGLLGRHALAITHRAHGSEATIAVGSPYGAYLIVEPISTPGYGTGIGAAPGHDDPSRLQAAGLTGALTSILYSYAGKRCREVKNGPSCTPSARATAPAG